MARAWLSLLAAALLFGAATPAAKVLVAGTGPVALAGLLYLGAGFALAAVVRARRPPSQLSARDLPWLGGAIVAGGIVGPVLLLVGLERTTASVASLVLGLEAVLTAVFAGALFGEHVGRRTWTALAVLTAGAILATGGAPGGANVAGTLAVTGACAAWALDNNLTREIAHADPRHVVLWKGLVAGAVNLTLALAGGAALPSGAAVAAALLVGALGYGMSLVLFVAALRELGSARTGAGFATAPFFGALLGVAVLGDPLTASLAGAAALVGCGSWLLLSEAHAHPHRHEALGHSHLHVHDEHHQHAHEAGEGAEPHAHWHVHEPVAHAHAHVPDLHHRHAHGSGDSS